MKRRLLLAFTLLAIAATTARAGFSFTWNAPSSVNVGQGYTVGVQAYFSPSNYNDSYAVLGLYRSGAQVGGGGTGAFGTATTSVSFTDNSPQTVSYSAEMHSYYGEAGYSSRSVTVNGAPADTTPPGAPQNLQISGLGNNGFTVSWSAPAGEAAAGYRVRLDSGSFTDVGTNTSHTFTGLTAGSSHTVEVQARDAVSNWSSSASYGVTTGGGGGSGGTQSNASVWLDVTGDGILDEIVRPSTPNFNYLVHSWYTTKVEFYDHPVNDFWGIYNLLIGLNTIADGYGRMYHDPSWSYYITTQARFALIFIAELPANQPYRVYRDLSGSDQLNPANWNLLFESQTGMSFSGLHSIFWEMPDALDLPESKYFLAKPGLPLASVRLNVPDLGELQVGENGQLRSLKLPDGTKITIEGTTVYVNNGAVVAGSTTNLSGGATLQVDNQGRATITKTTAAGTTTLIVNPDGTVEITVPGNQVSLARVVDSNGIVLPGNHQGMVWKRRGVDGQVETITAPEAGLNIGVTTADGQYQVGAQVGAAVFWFTAPARGLPKFTADPGKIHLGFDPPNPAEGDTANVYWASVIRGQSNTIVNFEAGSVAAAGTYELKIRNAADDDYVATSADMEISPRLFTEASPSLTISGLGTGGIKEVQVHLVDKGTNIVRAKLIVVVLPLRTIEVGIYTLEYPNSPATQFATAPALTAPSDNETIAVLNDTFKQAGVQFTKHISSGPRQYAYDTNLDGRMNPAEHDAMHAGPYAALFPLPWNRRIYYMRRSGIPYDYPDEMLMARGLESGNIFVYDTRGWSVVAAPHEMGHKLALEFPSNAADIYHDAGPYPPGVVGDNPNGVPPQQANSGDKTTPEYALMASGKPQEVSGQKLLPWLHGRWMRHESWNMANRKAGESQ